MRIVAWNCQQGATKKLAALETLAADILVVSEAPAIAPDGWTVEWIGRNPGKGLAVMARAGISLTVYPSYDPAWEWFLPLVVEEGAARFSMLAVWAMNARGAGPASTPRKLRTRRALECYQPMLERGDSIVVGDFNNNVFWDTPRHPWHTANVAYLQTLGYASLYHHSRAEAQGSESQPTFYWYRHRHQPYHIDHCYVPTAWLQTATLTIGHPDDWLDKSDHMPLVIDLRAKF